MEKGRTVILELAQKLFINWLEGADIDNVSFLVHLIVHLTLIGVVGLPLFLMFVKPLALNWFIHRLEHILYCFDALLEFVGEPREAS